MTVEGMQPDCALTGQPWNESEGDNRGDGLLLGAAFLATRFAGGIAGITGGFGVNLGCNQAVGFFTRGLFSRNKNITESRAFLIRKSNNVGVVAFF